MKNWFKKGRAAVMVLALTMISGTVVPAQAAPPDSGSIHFEVNTKGKDLEVSFYRVSDYINGEYVLTDEYAPIMKDPDYSDFIDINEMEVADDNINNAFLLQEWSLDHNIKPTFHEAFEGDVFLEDVPLGMYLVYQSDRDNDEISIDSYLLAVPYWQVSIKDNGDDGKVEEKKLIYNVRSFPKGEGPGFVTRETPTPTPTATPTPTVTPTVTPSLTPTVTPTPTYVPKTTPAPSGPVRTADENGNNVLVYGSAMVLGLAGVFLALRKSHNE